VVCYIHVGLFLFSCKQEVRKDPDELLAGSTSKQWKFDSLVTDGVKDTAAYDQCDLDDIYIFTADSFFVITEGATKCTEGASDTISVDKYKFNDSQTTLWIFELDEDDRSVITDTNVYVIVPPFTDNRLVLESYEGPYQVLEYYSKH